MVNTISLYRYPQNTSLDKPESSISKSEYFKAVKTAQKVDHQIYTKERLNRLGLPVTSNATGITNLVTAPITLATITYKAIKTSKSNQLPFDYKEAFVKSASTTASFVHAFGLLSQYLYVFAVKFASPLIATFAGAIFYPIEIVYNVWMLQSTHTINKTINEDLIKALAPLKDSSIYQNKAKFSKALKTLDKQLKANSSDLKQLLGKEVLEEAKAAVAHANFRMNKTFNIKEVHTNLNKKLLKTYTTTIQKSIQALQKSRLDLKSKDIKKLDEYARKAYKSLPAEKALYLTLEKIQKAHEDKKNKLSRLLRPWVVEKFTRESATIIKNLQSEDPKLVQKGIEQGLDLLNDINFVASGKQTVHFNACVMNFILLIMLAATTVALPFAIPVLISVTFFIWGVLDLSINVGLLDSPDKKFHVENLIPNWVKDSYNYLKTLSIFKSNTPKRKDVIKDPRSTTTQRVYTKIA